MDKYNAVHIISNSAPEGQSQGILTLDRVQSPGGKRARQCTP